MGDNGAATFRKEDGRERSARGEEEEEEPGNGDDGRLDEELRRQIAAADGADKEEETAEEGEKEEEEVNAEEEDAQEAAKEEDEENEGNEEEETNEEKDEDEHEEEAETNKAENEDKREDASEKEEEEDRDEKTDEKEEEEEEEVRSAGEEEEDKTLPPEVTRQLREAQVAAGQRGQYYQAFLRLERGRGHVTQEDMYTALQLLGQCPESREQVLELLQQHDCAEELSLEEFAAFCVRVCRSRQEVLEELERSFRVFDANGSGFLDREELRRALFRVGDSAIGEGDGGQEDFEELARLADTNGDGKIDCAEFCRLVTMGIGEMRLEAARRATEDGGESTDR